MPTPTDAVLLDGAVGTALIEAGVPASGRAWTARANRSHPAAVAALHQGYAFAGATHHTANTFRTRLHDVGADWRELLGLAVATCRGAVPPEHRVLGSLAPADDCYAPTTPPEQTRREHAEVADALADAGVDIILCETFTRAEEAWVATEVAVATGVPTWTSLCPGIHADGMTPQQLRAAAEGALERGAVRVLVNCVQSERARPYAQALAGLPFGIYANTWADVHDPAAYVCHAREWLASGAQIVGGCCGTTVAHIGALARYLHASEPP